MITATVTSITRRKTTNVFETCRGEVTRWKNATARGALFHQQINWRALFFGHRKISAAGRRTEVNGKKNDIAMFFGS